MPPCRKCFAASGAGSSAVLMQEDSVKAYKYQSQEKLPEIHRMGKGNPGPRHFQQQ